MLSYSFPTKRLPEGKGCIKCLEPLLPWQHHHNIMQSLWEVLVTTEQVHPSVCSASQNGGITTSFYHCMYLEEVHISSQFDGLKEHQHEWPRSKLPLYLYLIRICAPRFYSFFIYSSSLPHLHIREYIFEAEFLWVYITTAILISNPTWKQVKIYFLLRKCLQFSVIHCLQNLKLSFHSVDFPALMAEKKFVDFRLLWERGLMRGLWVGGNGAEAGKG